RSRAAPRAGARSRPAARNPGRLKLGKDLCRLSGRPAVPPDMRPLAAALIGLATLSAGTWGKAPSLPVPRSAHAVVVAGGAIHVLGGADTRRVDRFDGRRWTKETDLPGGTLNAPAAAAIGGKIYVIGGFSGTTNLPTATVRVFDTAT